MPASPSSRFAAGSTVRWRQVATSVWCVARRRNRCYAEPVAREVSVRELRNRTAEVVAAVRAGERLSLTVNRTPVADIVPHAGNRSPWVSSGALRRIVAEAPADGRLLEDLAAVRGTLVDES